MKVGRPLRDAVIDAVEESRLQALRSGLPDIIQVQEFVPPDAGYFYAPYGHSTSFPDRVATPPADGASQAPTDR